MRTQVLETHPHPKYPRLSLQRRSNSRFYQALTFLDGKLVQKSTKATHLPTALKLGEDWYRKLLRSSVSEGRQHPLDRLAVDPTVADVFASYRLTLSKPKQEYADMRWGPILDFWRTVVVTDITPKTFREFYAWRRKHTEAGTHTAHKDVIVIRQVLKHAIEEGHLTGLPTIPPAGTIVANPRPWLTPAEWKHLVHVASKRLYAAKDNPRVYQQRQDLNDFMVWMVTTMCRVDEALGVRLADCRIVQNERKKSVLVIQVKGKRGSRTIVAQERATAILQRRAKGRTPRDLIFPEHHRDAFRALLEAADLYTDAQGFTRNFKSLRATAISFRLLEPNPNLLMIARNAGTSLAMIDQFYAKRLSAEMHLEELSKPSTLVRLTGSRPSTFRTDPDPA